MGKRHDDGEFDVVFCTSFFHRGLKRRLYAHECGKKVFALRFRRKPSEPSTSK